MKEHLFVSSGDGALYDTRVPNWSSLPPLRKNYRYHHREIKSVADLKATLRAGPWAWPGGYPLHFICGDGEPLCFKCANKELKYIISAIQNGDIDKDAWIVVACDINYEDGDMQCTNCNKKIESAYGEER
jgi:hypothetical protein